MICEEPTCLGWGSLSKPDQVLANHVGPLAIATRLYGVRLEPLRVRPLRQASSDPARGGRCPLSIPDLKLSDF